MYILLCFPVITVCFVVSVGLLLVLVNPVEGLLRDLGFAICYIAHSNNQLDPNLMTLVMRFIANAESL